MTLWPTETLGSCCTIISGATPKTGVPEYWCGDICWATPNDLSALDAPEISDTPRKLTAAGLESCAASLLPTRSVLFSSRAPIGYVAINSVPMATNQGFKNFIPDPEKLIPEFLYWWLRAHRDYLAGKGNGATFKELSKAAVARVEVPLPPIALQQTIARRLDRAASLRRKRQEARLSLDAIAAALFQDRFGDPILNPRGYPVRPLADLVDNRRPITYGILKPGPDIADGIPYVRVLDMEDSGIEIAGLRRTSADIAHEYRRSTLASHDLLLSIRGHVGRVAATPAALAGANITQDTARLAISGVVPAFVRELLRMPSIQAWMAQRTKGVAVRGINLTDVKKLPVIIPPEQAQMEFADCVARIDRMRAAHARALAQANRLFAALEYRCFYPASDVASS